MKLEYIIVVQSYDNSQFQKSIHVSIEKMFESDQSII